MKIYPSPFPFEFSPDEDLAFAVTFTILMPCLIDSLKENIP